MALEFAGRLALETGARLTVVCIHRPAPAMPVPLPATRTASDMGAYWQAEDQAAQAQAGEVLDPLGVAWKIAVRNGDPAVALDGVANEHGAELIVVSGRGGSMGHRLRLGSVSDRLVRHADRPVLVVR
jgi:nucleotide-binding universal stress UspA family protein